MAQVPDHGPDATYHTTVCTTPDPLVTVPPGYDMFFYL